MRTANLKGEMQFCRNLAFCVELLKVHWWFLGLGFFTVLQLDVLANSPDVHRVELILGVLGGAWVGVSPACTHLPRQGHIHTSGSVPACHWLLRHTGTLWPRPFVDAGPDLHSRIFLLPLKSLESEQFAVRSCAFTVSLWGTALPSPASRGEMSGAKLEWSPRSHSSLLCSNSLFKSKCFVWQTSGSVKHVECSFLKEKQMPPFNMES